MEHDIYYERQRALIERSLQAEREREELSAMMRSYRHEVAAKKAYTKIMGIKRHKITSVCKGRRSPKKVSTSIEHGVGMTMRTKRFDNSHITVCYKCRAI